MARKRLLVGAGVVGVTGALSFAVPAAAHYTCAYHNNDHACLMTVPGYDHGRLAACDGERDGHRVRAQYYTLFNPARQYGNWDPNGPADGCAVNLSSMPITSYRVCEEEVGCSAWRNNT